MAVCYDRFLAHLKEYPALGEVVEGFDLGRVVAYGCLSVAFREFMALHLEELAGGSNDSLTT